MKLLKPKRKRSKAAKPDATPSKAVETKYNAEATRPPTECSRSPAAIVKKVKQRAPWANLSKAYPPRERVAAPWPWAHPQNKHDEH